MKKIYAVKSLFESIVTPDSTSERIFEERIILVESENKEKASEQFIQHFPPDTYANSMGGLTTNRLAKILDIFELVDELGNDVNYKEVYSRFLIFDKNITVKEVIEQYKLDK